MQSNITLYTRSTSWIEGESIRQLERVAALPGMLRVAGFPDLHPGKGGPVGAAMLAEGILYPYLIGSDVGCGMMLCSTDFDSAKARPEKWAKKLKGLEEPLSEEEIQGYQVDSNAVPAEMRLSLGTIGHGNHFAEFLKIKDLYDEVSLRFLGLKKGELALLVHSGSRGHGEKLLRAHVDIHRDGGLEAGSAEAYRYLAAHNQCLAWAKENRFVVADRLFRQIDPSGGVGCCGDWCHNSITGTEYEGRECFLHRKGAAPSDEMHVFIPGSRGSLSYLIKPIGDQSANLWSIAHGAGRKWSRSECEGRLRERYSSDSMKKTKLGSYVVCDDKALLYEEAPQAYKDIDAVVADLTSFGLVSVVATFIPVLTYKVRGR
jgi:release factor H-coupled RctB family protein